MTANTSRRLDPTGRNSSSTDNGGFVALEFTGEINVDGWSISARDQDVLLARVNSNGSIEWVRYFGSTIQRDSRLAHVLSVDSAKSQRALLEVGAGAMRT